MKTRTLLAAVLLVLCVAGSGCRSSSQGHVLGANLTRNEVIKLARAEARKERFDLDKYDLKSVHYANTGERAQTWTVSFDGKPPTPPGDHVLVWIDDRMLDARLMRGE